MIITSICIRFQFKESLPRLIDINHSDKNCPDIQLLIDHINSGNETTISDTIELSLEDIEWASYRL